MIAGAILAVGALGTIMITPEPSADGRSLSEWLRLGLDNQFRRDNSDVTNAVRKIGVKAIPILLEKAGAKDSFWKNKLTSTRVRTLFSTKWIRATGYHHAEASWGFSILGTQAVSAIPDLSTMLLDGRGVGYLMGSIGPDALPVLKAALTNENRDIRMEAILGITARPDIAQLSLREIVALRHTTNELEAIVAVIRAASVLPERDRLLLINGFLADSRPRIQLAILAVLASRGINASNAVPILIPFLTNSVLSVRERASNTLLRTDSSQALEHGVRSNPPALRFK